MIKAIGPAANDDGSSSQKSMHNLIEIGLGGMTEKMEVIAHQDEGMDC